jgi:hypothetical protein
MIQPEGNKELELQTNTSSGEHRMESLNQTAEGPKPANRKLEMDPGFVLRFCFAMCRAS